MSRIHLRLAHQGDVTAIQAVRNAVRENRLTDPGSIKDADVAGHLQQRGRGWVCEAENRIVGFVIADAIEASIWALFLLPEWEGLGLGRRLLNTAGQWLFGQGCKEIRLCTAAGTRAHGFYLHLGWKELGATQNGEVRLGLRQARVPDAPPANRTLDEYRGNGRANDDPPPARTPSTPA